MLVLIRWSIFVCFSGLDFSVGDLLSYLGPTLSWHIRWEVWWVTLLSGELLISCVIYCRTLWLPSCVRIFISSCSVLGSLPPAYTVPTSDLKENFRSMISMLGFLFRARAPESAHLAHAHWVLGPLAAANRFPMLCYATINVPHYMCVDALYKQCFKHPPFQHSMCDCMVSLKWCNMNVETWNKQFELKMIYLNIKSTASNIINNYTYWKWLLYFVFFLPI